MTTCPNCQNPIPDSAQFCARCGTPNPGLKSGTPGGAHTGGTSSGPAGGASGSYSGGASGGYSGGSESYPGGPAGGHAGGGSESYPGGPSGSHAGGAGGSYSSGPSGSQGGSYSGGTGGGYSGGAGGGYSGGAHTPPPHMGGSQGGQGGGGHYGGHGGHGGHGGGSAQNIPDYLVQSIVALLCCCLPLGVVALIFSIQTRSKKDAGDFAGAMESSRKAKMWCWITLGAGILVWIINLAINGIAFMAALAGGGGG